MIIINLPLFITGMAIIILRVGFNINVIQFAQLIIRATENSFFQSSLTKMNESVIENRDNQIYTLISKQKNEHVDKKKCMAFILLFYQKQYSLKKTLI